MNIKDTDILIVYDNDKLRFLKGDMPKPTEQEIIDCFEDRTKWQIPIKIKMIEFEVKETKTEYIINMKYIQRNEN